MLSTKANIEDLPRAANPYTSIPSSQGHGGVMEDVVDRQDLMFMLSNKVSIEEFQRIMDQKQNLLSAKQNF